MSRCLVCKEEFADERELYSHLGESTCLRQINNKEGDEQTETRDQEVDKQINNKEGGEQAETRDQEVDKPIGKGRKYDKIEPMVKTKIVFVERNELEPSVRLHTAGFQISKWFPKDIMDPLSALQEYSSHVQHALSSHIGKKWLLSLEVSVYREIREMNGRNTREYKTIKFSSSFKININHLDINENFLSARDQIVEDWNTWLRNGSDWHLERVQTLILKTVRYNPAGASWFPLPKQVNSQAILNIRNKCLNCFEYSCLGSILYDEEESKEIGIKKYKRSMSNPGFYKDFIGKRLNMQRASKPMQIEDISNFESDNPDLSINVWLLESGEYEIKPLYCSLKTSSGKKTINLLLIQKETMSHYCTIINLGLLLKTSGYSKYAVWRHPSPLCSKEFKLNEMSSSERKKHMKECVEHHGSINNNPKQEMVIPFGEKAFVKFMNYSQTIKANVMFYADFETMNIPLQTAQPPQKKSKTNSTENQEKSYSWKKTVNEAYSFALITVAEGEYEVDPIVYRGEDAGAVFIDTVLEQAERAINYFKENSKPLQMGKEEEERFQKENTCHLCEETIYDEDDKVRNHDHVTGKFLGACHNRCNLSYKQNYKVSVALHNLKGFDQNCILKSIKKRHPDPQVIGQTLEKYISFSIGRVVFKDTFQFLANSLSNLTENLKADKERSLEENFSITLKYFNKRWKKELEEKGRNIDEAFKMITSKLIFPYRYIDSFEKFEETEIPSQEKFFNDLSEESVSDELYANFKRLWFLFDLKNIGELSDLYVAVDTALLADIFENLRRVSFSTIGLDPAHSFTAAGLSWSGALKVGKLKIEIPQSKEIHDFIDNNLRGGVAQGSIPYSKANNPLLKDYDSTKPISYIYFFDCNGLYARAMEEKLPYNDWVKVDVHSEDWLNIQTDGEHGYWLEVDLSYPSNLHDAHDGFPLCPEHYQVNFNELSNYQLSLANRYNLKETKIKKLMTTFHDKNKIGLHIRLLQFYCKFGLELTKVHRVFKFRQANFLKKYMDMCHWFKTSSDSAVMRQFGKLLANSLYGKLCEDVKKQREIKLTTKDKVAQKIVKSPYVKSFDIFDDSKIFAFEMIKKKVLLNKPRFVGATILELSKYLVYDWYYNEIVPLFQKIDTNIKISYQGGDTDSICLKISNVPKNVDVQKILREQGAHWFDSSNYPKEHPSFSLINKNKNGCWKDECEGIPIKESVFLRSKLYSIEREDEKTKQAGKGILGVVRKKKLTHKDYVNCLFEETINYNKGHKIQTERHNIYLVETQKVSLSPFNDKIWLTRNEELNEFITHSFGHYKLKQRPYKLKQLTNEEQKPKKCDNEEQF